MGLGSTFLFWISDGNILQMCSNVFVKHVQIVSSWLIFVQQSTGLAFIAIPEATLSMDVPPLWSFLFFFMMINLALSSICRYHSVLQCVEMMMLYLSLIQINMLHDNYKSRQSSLNNALIYKTFYFIVECKHSWRLFLMKDQSWLSTDSRF